MRAALEKNPDAIHLRITSGSPGEQEHTARCGTAEYTHRASPPHTHTRGEMPTFAGGARHLELVHEASELLSHGHGAQETLVVEEVFLAPLGALLVLGVGGGRET